MLRWLQQFESGQQPHLLGDGGCASAAVGGGRAVRQAWLPVVGS